jgi:hypothetical protein
MSADFLSNNFSTRDPVCEESARRDSISQGFTSGDWSVYRTRFLVRATQLTQPLTFSDPLGRVHRGLPGDYLVQSSEGLLRIAPREIFEDVYIRLEPQSRQNPFGASDLRPQPELTNLSA